MPLSSLYFLSLLCFLDGYMSLVLYGIDAQERESRTPVPSPSSVSIFSLYHLTIQDGKFWRGQGRKSGRPASWANDGRFHSFVGRPRASSGPTPLPISLPTHYLPTYLSSLAIHLYHFQANLISCLSLPLFDQLTWEVRFLGKWVSGDPWLYNPVSLRYKMSRLVLVQEYKQQPPQNSKF